MVDSKNKQTNKAGNKRGIHPNSLNNLKNGHRFKKGEIANPNGRPKKEYSITSIQKGMMGQICPYAKDPSWTWAYALAEAGMKDALTEEKARENLKDRFEGKIALPVEASGAGGEPLVATFIFQMPDGSKFNPSELARKSTDDPIH